VSATSETGYTPAYVFDNQWRAARERLQMVEVCCDPLTEAHFDHLGVGPGWHCLEIGAGAGSVARMLSDRVGPGGRVLAAGLAGGWARSLPRLLDAAGLDDTGSSVDLMTFGGGSPLAQFMSITMEQLMENPVYSDTDRDVMEAGRAEILKPDGTYVAWDLVTAWGRRPR
jgi:hypothetical protein